MDGEDADDLLDGFGGGGLGLGEVLIAALGDPLDEGAEGVFGGGGEFGGAVDEHLQVGGAFCAVNAMRELRLEQAGFVQYEVDELGQGAVAQAVAQAAQLLKAVAQRAVVFVGHGMFVEREAGAAVGIVAGVDVVEEFLVGGGGERGFEGGHDGDFVGGVVDGHEDVGEVVDFGAGEEAASAVEVVGDGVLVEGFGVGIDRGAGADQDGDIAHSGRSRGSAGLLSLTGVAVFARQLAEAGAVLGEVVDQANEQIGFGFTGQSDPLEHIAAVDDDDARAFAFAVSGDWLAVVGLRAAVLGIGVQDLGEGVVGPADEVGA